MKGSGEMAWAPEKVLESQGVQGGCGPSEAGAGPPLPRPGAAFLSLRQIRHLSLQMSECRFPE